MEGYKIGNKSITMPSSWQDVTYSKGVQILDGDLDQIEILALLTNTTVKEIRTSTDAESIYYFTNSFEFLQNLPDPINEFPRSIQLGVDLITFPFISYYDKFDLGNADVGQVEDMLNIIRKMNTEFIGDEDREELTQPELIQICPYLVAIYIQKFLDKDYDGERALLLMDRVKELSFKEVVSIGYFFLNRLNHYLNGSQSKWTRRNTIPKRLKRAWKNLMQRLVSMLP